MPITKPDRSYLNLTITRPAKQLLRDMQQRTKMRPGQVIERLLYEEEAREEGRREERTRILGLLTAEAS